MQGHWAPRIWFERAIKPGSMKGTVSHTSGAWLPCISLHAFGWTPFVPGFDCEARNAWKGLNKDVPQGCIILQSFAKHPRIRSLDPCSVIHSPSHVSAAPHQRYGQLALVISLIHRWVLIKGSCLFNGEAHGLWRISPSWSSRLIRS